MYEEEEEMADRRVKLIRNWEEKGCKSNPDADATAPLISPVWFFFHRGNMYFLLL